MIHKMITIILIAFVTWFVMNTIMDSMLFGTPPRPMQPVKKPTMQKERRYDLGKKPKEVAVEDFIEIEYAAPAPTAGTTVYIAPKDIEEINDRYPALQAMDSGVVMSHVKRGRIKHLRIQFDNRKGHFDLLPCEVTKLK